MDKSKRSVGVLQLTIVAYLTLCGGPYGLEPSLGAGGPLLSCLSAIVIPLLMGLPLALISSEMGSLFSEDGSTVMWGLSCEQRVNDAYQKQLNKVNEMQKSQEIPQIAQENQFNANN